MWNRQNTKISLLVLTATFAKIHSFVFNAPLPTIRRTVSRDTLTTTSNAFSRRDGNFLFSKRDHEDGEKGGDNEDQGQWRGDGGCQMNYDDLDQRLWQMRAQVLEEEFQQPPNPNLSPKAFIRHILEALWNHSDPLPDSGFRVLLRSSTPSWRKSLFQSVGAPKFANEEMVASALSETIGRPNNQFAILVPDEDQDDYDQDTADNRCENNLPYLIDFPSDELDYGDGTCWVECRLRSKPERGRNSTLYVVMGWQLVQRKTDGAWLIHRIDWQDFRDAFRPGIGREEWMRICG